MLCNAMERLLHRCWSWLNVTPLPLQPVWSETLPPIYTVNRTSNHVVALYTNVRRQIGSKFARTIVTFMDKNLTLASAAAVISMERERLAWIQSYGIAFPNKEAQWQPNLIMAV